MQIPKDETWIRKHRWFLYLVALLLLVTTLIIGATGVLDPTDDDAKALIIDRVTQQPFEKTVSAYGRLKPQKKRTLISHSAGTVVEVHKRSGEKVQQESVVLTLSNPEVESAVHSAKLDLQKAQSQLDALNAELLDKQLAMENDRLLLEAEIETKKVELHALEKLAGKSIVSEIDLRKERMRLRQMELKLALAKKREQSFSQSSQAQRESSELAVEQAGYVLKTKQEAMRDLEVVAGMDGVLQSQQSSLELGEWVRQGQALGVVSATDDLYAELNVNAAEASSVQLGMKTVLDIRGHKVEGKVVRVAPNASQNQVQVDVEITQDLPGIARASLDIRGDIQILHQQQALTLKRPPDYRNGHSMKLYVKEQGDTYRLQEVSILAASENQILLGDSLNQGAEVILNGADKWQQRTRIQLH